MPAGPCSIMCSLCVEVMHLFIAYSVMHLFIVYRYNACEPAKRLASIQEHRHQAVDSGSEGSWRAGWALDGCEYGSAAAASMHCSHMQAPECATGLEWNQEGCINKASWRHCQLCCTADTADCRQEVCLFAGEGL